MPTIQRADVTAEEWRYAQRTRAALDRGERVGALVFCCPQSRIANGRVVCPDGHAPTTVVEMLAGLGLPGLLPTVAHDFDEAAMQRHG